MKKKIFVAFLLVFFLIPSISFASVGVGVATGKIIIEEGLNPGESYVLPNFSVINTGDETTTYATVIEYRQDITEMNPDKEWFSMEPSSFRLEPGEAANVTVKLAVPIKVKPGDYFAFISAHPVKDAETPGASMNVAAASKLYFTIKPANIFQGIYYKTISFFVNNAPWSYIVLVVVVLAALMAFFKHNFSLNFKVDKKSDNKDDKEKE